MSGMSRMSRIVQPVRSGGRKLAGRLPPLMLKPTFQSLPDKIDDLE